MERPEGRRAPVPVRAVPVEHARSRATVPSAGLSLRRKLAALAIAVIADALSVGLAFFEPAEIALDLATALALFAVLGLRWTLLPVLVLEAIPGVAAFPTWVLAVGMLVGTTPTSKAGQAP